MRRREFILLGAVPLASIRIAHADTTTMPVVGVLTSHSRSSVEGNLASFRDGLAEIGFIDGRNVAFEYRWADGRYEHLPALASELVARGVAVIVTSGAVVSARAAKAATGTIPIVFIVGGDPVAFHLVRSLNRPGENVTGVSMVAYQLDAKRLELLLELVPSVAAVAMLLNPASPQHDAQWLDVQAAARGIGVHVLALKASTEAEIRDAIATARDRQPGALLVSSDPFFQIRRDQIVALAARHGIPAIYPWHEYVTAGGLMSYGPSLALSYSQAGNYAGRILRGEKPADLPVMQPTRFELVINLKTARALRLDIPPTLLARADEVIE